jgi:hypothetical protein
MTLSIVLLGKWELLEFKHLEQGYTAARIGARLLIDEWINSQYIGTFPSNPRIFSNASCAEE